MKFTAETIKRAREREMSRRNGVVYGMPHAEYLSGDEVSASGLKLLAEKTPAHYLAMMEGRYKVTSKAFKFGTNAHARLLEPDRFASAYAVGPEARRNSVEWKKFESNQLGARVGIKPSEAQEIETMVRVSQESCSDLKKLLSAPGKTEVSIFVTDPATGLRIKIRPDKIIESTDFIIVMDLKTAESAAEEDFRWYIKRYRYDIAAALYSRVVENIMDKKVVFFWGVIEETSFISAVYQPTEEDIFNANEEIDSLLSTISECKKTNFWPGYGDLARKISMPKKRGW